MDKRKKEGQNSVTFSKLALALANDYESIYVIDANKDSYVEYTAAGKSKTLTVVSSGDDFYSDLIKNSEILVYPDDREYFRDAFKRDTIHQKLDNGKSFSLEYRLIKDGKPCYYFLKTIREGEGSIIVGVRNIDAQKKIELAFQEKSRTYSEIAGSLASLFEVIYHIDISTGHYTEYSSSESFAKLGLDRGGEDFFTCMEVKIRKIVHPDDCERLIAILQKEALLKRLSRTGSVSVTYRQLLDGKEQYVDLIAFRKRNDAKSLVIGVMNVDAQKRFESESAAYEQIARALASRYEAIYHINTDTNEYTMYRSSEIYSKLGFTKQGKDFFEDAADDIKHLIYPEDVERVLNEMNKEHLIRNLMETGSLSFNFRQQLDGRPRHMNMLVVRPKNDKTHIVIGVTNIDAQIRREMLMQEESRAFSEIAKALAQRYEVIYNVDLITNEYHEYSASESYAKLKIGTLGSDFFAESQENLKRDVYIEDQPLVAFSLQKENMIENLRETGKYFLNYRLMLDGKPQYVMLFAVRPKEDSTHIIVAVANVDTARRREMDFEESLNSAMDLANRDVLTGVKNKRAYVQMEMEIDEHIENSTAADFCVLVCDINGLKQINDNHGHNSGDDFIKSACEFISGTFKHSPLYRIGGDEFAVILRDGDYEARDKLIAEFGHRQEEHIKKGLVTVAFGYSDYHRDSDMRLQDVFERADNAMYENKKLFKKGVEREENAAVSGSENETDKRFNELFAQLISAMTDMYHIDIPRIESLLIDISLLLRLSKGVTRLYRNPIEEKQGGGETLCCFDLGVEGVEIRSLRIVTSVMSIATLTIYMAKDAEPHSEIEAKRLDLVMRALLSFVSRNRLRDIVEELAFFDDGGYANQRKLRSYLDSKDLRGKSVIAYNLRHFSLVNQEIGKYAGDIVMRNHYKTLTDMIGGNGIVCRLGGDNFTAVCANEQVEEITEFLFESPVIYDPAERRSVNISASAGIVSVPENAESSEGNDLMGKSIMCLREAQNGGKERIVYFNSTILSKKEKSKRVQQLFPEAMRKEEFLVFYQPKVDINTGELSGAEALCRWFRNGEIVPPANFIPMLEETNDICKLDFYMLDHVCADIRRWLDEKRDPVRVSVNLSRKHMMDTGLTDTITEIIDRHGIPHDLIEIELTETTSDVEFNDLKRVVSGLQSAGILTVVDDFGIGYSSLNLIRAIPWNGLKVDRSFLPVDEDNSSSSRSIMFKHVVAMAKEMGLECVAEGVETVQQLKIMKSLGCDFAQGFLFDRPIPRDEFVRRLTERRYTLEGRG